MGHLKSLWEADLGVAISDDEWEDFWLRSSGCLSTNKVKEMQFKNYAQAPDYTSATE